MNVFRPFTLATLVAASPLIAGEDDLLKMVDQGSDLTFYISDTKTTQENWKKSPLRSLYDNDEVKPRFEEALEEILAFEEIEDEEVAEILREGLTKIYEEITGEVLLNFEIPELDQDFISLFIDEAPPEKIIPAVFKKFGVLGLAEVSDAEEYQKAVKELLETLVKKIEEADEDTDYTIKMESIDDAEVIIINVEEKGVSLDVCFFGLHEKTAFFAAGAHDVKDTIAHIKNGHETPLSDSDYLAEGRSDMQIIGDTKDLMASMKLGIGTALEHFEMMDKLQINLDGGWKAIALEGYRRFGLSLDLSKPDVLFDGKIDVPEEGLLSYFASPKPIEKPSIHAHKNVVLVGQAHIDLPGFYDELMKTIGVISPMGPMAIGVYLGQFEKQVGIKIREDLLASLDTKLEYLQVREEDASVEASPESYGFIIGLKDKEKFEGTIKTLVAGMEMEIAIEEFLEETIYSIPFPQGGGKISYAFHEEDVIFGLNSGIALKEILKQINNPQETLWESDAFADYQHFLEDDPVSLAFEDAEASMQTVFDALGAMQDEEEGVDFSNIKIPFSYSLTSYWVKDGLMTTKGVLLAK